MSAMLEKVVTRELSLSPPNINGTLPHPRLRRSPRFLCKLSFPIIHTHQKADLGTGSTYLSLRYFKIIVGNEDIEFSVLKTHLCRKSEYFKAAEESQFEMVVLVNGNPKSSASS